MIKQILICKYAARHRIKRPEAATSEFEPDYEKTLVNINPNEIPTRVRDGLASESNIRRIFQQPGFI